MIELNFVSNGQTKPQVWWCKHGHCRNVSVSILIALRFTTSNDFGSLLESGAHSDVVFKVGSSRFPAHKVILSARSEVFAAMFAHDTKENRTNEVDIIDCHPDIFKELLQYIYTGSRASVKHTYQLYVMAEKYALEGLKEICETEVTLQRSKMTCRKMMGDFTRTPTARLWRHSQ